MLAKSLSLYFALAAALFVFGMACGGGDEEEETPPAETTPTAKSLEMRNFAFQPISLTVAKGERLSLTLENKDSAAHTFTIDALDINVEIKGNQQAKVDLAPAAEGRFVYYCQFHPNMTGALQVGMGAGAPSTTPAGAGGGGY